MNETKSFPVSKAFAKELIDLYAVCLENRTHDTQVNIPLPQFDVLVDIKFDIKFKG